MSDAQTRVVVERHLAAWQRGDMATLMADYADDAIMMNKRTGALVGKEAIAAMYARVFAEMFRPDDTTLTVETIVCNGNYALVHWEARTSTFRTVGGFDTFVLRDGLIVAQSGGAESAPLE